MTAAGTGTRGSRPGELHRRRVLRRVLLLSESAALSAMLDRLLDGTASLARLDSPDKALQPGCLDDADLVVLDLPREGSDTLLAQLRDGYHGDLVVLGDHGLPRSGVAEPAWTHLPRPFSADELRAALGLVPELARPRAPAEAEHPTPPAVAFAADLKAAAPKAPSWDQIAGGQAGRAGFGGRTGSRLAALVRGWRAKRRAQVAGFSVFALVAFTVAFILAAQGHCGPGCDALGTGFLPAPTAAPRESRAAAVTTGPKRSTTSTGPTGSAGTRAFGGIAGGGVPGSTTTTSLSKATTTTGSPGGSATTRPATTRPATTRPATTQSTAPTTTGPTTTDPPPTT